MKRLIIIYILFVSVSAFAGEKEEINLQIQIMQERIARIDTAIYFLPYEKKYCADMLNALLEKQKKDNKQIEKKGE